MIKVKDDTAMVNLHGDVDYKTEYEIMCQKFQQETLRNSELTRMIASLKQQPDAGALVRALEDIADNDDEEARNLGLLADIIFTAKQALKKYRGEK